MILHVTPHLGGGVGRVLSSVACYSKKNQNEYQHSIVCLEQPEKIQYIELAKANGVPVYVAPNQVDLCELIETADIVQFEWWHHPLMIAWLNSFTFLPDIRSIIWCHISGHYTPVISPDLINITDFVMFTSPYTCDSPYLQDFDWADMTDKVGIVCSSGGFEVFSPFSHCDHEGFNIGYVGTMDFSKLHPNFVDFCAEVALPDARFIMVGDANTKQLLENCASRYGILDKIEFVGHTDDVVSQLSRFDVFGYPLNPEHFGTAENALLEAMASAIPPVLLNQAAEKYIVKHMETGMLVKNREEYGQAMRYLYYHPDERKRMGENARKHVITKYSLEKTVQQLNSHYENLMKLPKRKISFKGIFGNSPAEWFINCLGNDRLVFKLSMNLSKDASEKELTEIEIAISNCRQIVKGKSKSSIFQFYRYFPEDRWLTYWAKLIKQYNA